MTEPVITEWLCKFCNIWNQISHRFCRKCLGKQQYSTKEQR